MILFQSVPRFYMAAVDKRSRRHPFFPFRLTFQDFQGTLSAGHPESPAVRLEHRSRCSLAAFSCQDPALPDLQPLSVRQQGKGTRPGIKGPELVVEVFRFFVPVSLSISRVIRDA